MSIGIWQIAIVVILVVLLFGRGKISSLMGDVARELKVLKKEWRQMLLTIQSQKIFPTKIKTQKKKIKSHAYYWLV